jgi:peptide/nickel transport system ATP-binding protein
VGVIGGPRETLVEVSAVSKRFEPQGRLLAIGRLRARSIRALHEVSLEIVRGEIFGVAGESGSGKTTLAEIIVRLNVPTAGRVLVGGRDVGALGRRQLKAFRREAQIVFQNPYDAHNPRFTVRQTVEEPLKIHGVKSETERLGRVARVLEQVRLRPPAQFLDKFVHQLSGGERQRLSIARALTLSPKLLIADEPTSMLDVSVRAGILNLLRELNRTKDLTVMIISHDLCSLVQVCDRIAVMRRGIVVEIGPALDVAGDPRHPYTRALLAAVPDFDPERPGNSEWISRTPMVDKDEEQTEGGAEEALELVEVAAGHYVRGGARP